MKILNLHVENIKRVKVVDITPQGNTVIISGKNGQGKSSTMDSIAMALGGGELVPDKPIRDGEETGQIRVDLGEYIVTRHWTNPTTSYLKLETKDGLKVSNAQTILDKIIGDLTFDPLEFVHFKASERLDILKKITGVDFSELEAKYRGIYETRTNVGRKIDQIKALMSEQYSELPQEKPVVIDVSDIQHKRDEARKSNNVIEQAKASIAGIKRDIDRRVKEIEQMQKELEAVHGDLKRSEEIGSRPTVDLTTFDNAIENNLRAKVICEKFDAKAKLAAQLSTEETVYKAQTAELETIKATKDKLVAAAAMPVDGLAFGKGEVDFKGIPFAQLSTSEQIRVSFAIAIKLNPKLRVAMIKNGSLLDDEGMALITKFATDENYQLWIERVGRGDANSIYIENGEVVR